ncbi:MAG TPA: KTSC domain-containing protein [Kiritimatiellae bacterium]|nr:KTSC domain-containing protein [Kiritimatiellia bacterium]
MKAWLTVSLVLAVAVCGCSSTGRAPSGGFVPVKSSVLDSVRYDATSQNLVIVFDNGDIYEYHGVPPSVYEGLMTAESKGRYFHENIRDKYQYKKW